jgi:glycosyltransferase involved in cell wall biosynthesis
MKEKKHIYILLDIFLKKNELQHNILIQNGYIPIWFQCNYKEAKENNSQKIILPNSILTRSIFLLKELIKNKKNIHHVEIYPGGRFAFIFSIICKLLSLKIICAERGDLLYYHKNGYPLLTRISMYFTYKLANVVWYRELYMKQKLDSLKVKNVSFFHNVTTYPNFVKRNKGKFDFIWVNRLIEERFSNWFIDALKKPIFINTQNILLGLQNENNQSKYANENKTSNIELISYSNPKEYYENGSFFVLPAKIVFANNSLLEAMSYGVVPIVSKTEGTDLIVKNGINGFVFETYEEFLECMIKAHELSENDYLRLSNNARETIKNDFSVEYYTDNLLKLYKSLY